MNIIRRLFHHKLIATFVLAAVAQSAAIASQFIETPENPKPVYLGELRPPWHFYESVDHLINVRCNYSDAMKLIEYHKNNGAGRYDAMIAKLERLVLPKIPPPHEAELFVRKANFLMNQHRYLEAERELRICVARYPSYPPAYSALGMSLLIQKRNKEAFAITQKGCEVAKPTNLHQLTDLAGFYLITDNFKKAAEINLQKLKMDPQDPNAVAFFTKFDKDGRALPEPSAQ
jgi:tetratricopeptide (TPR) repeat protein